MALRRGARRRRARPYPARCEGSSPLPSLLRLGRARQAEEGRGAAAAHAAPPLLQLGRLRQGARGTEREGPNKETRLPTGLPGTRPLATETRSQCTHKTQTQGAHRRCCMPHLRSCVHRRPLASRHWGRSCPRPRPWPPRRSGPSTTFSDGLISTPTLRVCETRSGPRGRASCGTSHILILFSHSARRNSFL